MSEQHTFASGGLYRQNVHMDVECYIMKQCCNLSSSLRSAVVARDLVAVKTPVRTWARTTIKSSFSRVPPYVRDSDKNRLQLVQGVSFGVPERPLRRFGSQTIDQLSQQLVRAGQVPCWNYILVPVYAPPVLGAKNTKIRVTSLDAGS